MKAVVAAFNQEKALVGAFPVITNLRMELFQALLAILRCSDPHGWILYSSSCCRKGKIMNFKKSGKILILKITFIAMCYLFAKLQFCTQKSTKEQASFVRISKYPPMMLQCCTHAEFHAGMKLRLRHWVDIMQCTLCTGYRLDAVLGSLATLLITPLRLQTVWWKQRTAISSNNNRIQQARWQLQQVNDYTVDLSSWQM